VPLKWEELQDQFIDRLSFQQFAGLSFNEEITDFTTIWHFKEALANAKLMDAIFNQIVSQIEEKGLILKKGTMVDAKIIQSGNRPLEPKTYTLLFEITGKDELGKFILEDDPENDSPGRVAALLFLS
jgi:IS5 family transposase